MEMAFQQRTREQTRPQGRQRSDLTRRRRQNVTDENNMSLDFDTLVQKAEEQYQVATNAVEYQFCASERHRYLGNQQEHLQDAIIALSPLSKDRYDILCHLNASLLYQTGQYDEAEDQYRSLYPYLSMESQGLIGFRETFPDGLNERRIGYLLDYVIFLITSGRRLDFAGSIIRVLQWVPASFPFRENILHDTIRVLNSQSNFCEASNYLMVLRNLHPDHLGIHHPGCMYVQSAITEAGQGLQSEAQTKFINWFVLGSVVKGIWHTRPLSTLYYFGKALRDWNRPEEAIVILNECYRGSTYRFGGFHPTSRRALETLATCGVSKSSLKTLQRLGGMNYHQESRLAEAYERIHIDVAVDLFQLVENLEIDYRGLVTILEQYQTSFDARRNIARCEFRLGNTSEAVKILEALWLETRKDDERRLLIQLDMVMYKTESSNPNESLLRISKSMLRKINHEDACHKDQFNALHRKLASNGFTHFTQKMLAENPPLISEQHSEPLGTGAYGIVDSIQIGTKLYARKSIMLPRYNQKSIRDSIANELSAVRTLGHPHVIRVHLTYEDKSRFFIVMRPLADYDLEAYLAEYSQTPPTQAQTEMIWKWFLCLSNTLAFIHSKGIRHKDIKPRNILVKGEKVIFADFGSSHAFFDEGKSTTEGPAFGHTKIYCAPEVISNEKRGRSTDIFSLGCVFTELVVWLAGYSIADWIKERETVVDGTPNTAYSATLNRIEEWFNSKVLPYGIRTIYVWLIKSTICKEPDKRIEAANLGALVSSTYDNLNEKPMQECTKCSLKLWVHSNEESAESDSQVRNTEEFSDADSESPGCPPPT
ncbi:kinase-like domain-containing protein [Pyrenochaeta sp. MPI-SDFR-AT-0127]|nr:kinase-like domain-containing protein [Pyrenochaeta sp. MPI-SDFR-AT-0127]